MPVRSIKVGKCGCIYFTTYCDFVNRETQYIEIFFSKIGKLYKFGILFFAYATKLFYFTTVLISDMLFHPTKKLTDRRYHIK